ncbi:MAG: LacI family DNA-binding transcriptional regulator [Victivallaceae bacterium]|nr:LacI family DNA-binding transcriptional regulator [Victivallaceae bacterium]
MTVKKLTIKEFAALLGVSTATVSRAFSSKGRISAETRRRIITRAKESGYRPNIHARNLSTSASSAITLYYPEFSNEEPDYFIAELMLGINRTLAKYGKILQISPFPLETSEVILDLCRDQILSGAAAGIIIIAGSKTSRELYECAAGCGMPEIVIGHMREVRYNNVWFDNRRGAFLAGRYFRETGRRHPAYLGGVLDRRKQNGFSEGFQLPESEIIKAGSGFGFRDGYRILDIIAAEHPETDCILCANDVMAMGFIAAARERGIRIPQDIAVIGYDDIHPARYYSPALSSVSLQLTRLGEAAALSLERLIGGTTDLPPELIECELIIRESS